MKKLYTEREKIRYANILVLVVFLWFIILDIYYKGIHSNFFEDSLVFFIVFGIVEAGLLCIWYPERYKKNAAIKKGEMYYGKIRDIQVRNRKPLHLIRQSYVYIIIIECDINSEKKIWEQGNYTDNPRNYVPKDYKCKVYVYGNKYFVQDFYGEGTNKEKKSKNQTIYNPNLMDVVYGKYDNKEINSFLNYSMKEIPYVDNDEM